jgi:carbamoyl-phosphate synthase large subunit
MILGSGPTGSGQGSSSTTAACHASFALQEMGVEVDHGETAIRNRFDRTTTLRTALYLSRFTLEHPFCNICDSEKTGTRTCQFGGKTPLNLAQPLKRLGVPIIGTDPGEYRSSR